MKKRILSLVLVVAMVATLFAGLTITASAATVSGTFTRITSLSDLTTGKYVVVGHQKAAELGKLTYGTLASKGRLPYTEEYTSVPSTIVNPDGASVWDITVSGSSVTLYNAENSVYLAAGSTAGYLAFSATSGTSYTVSCNDSGRFTFANGSNFLCVNNGADYWREYAASTSYSNGACLELYKLGGTTPPASEETTAPSSEDPTPSSEEPVPSGDDYTLVTDASVLTAGDKLLLVGVKNGTYYALAPYASGNNCRCNEVAAPVDGVITTDVADLTLGGAAGAWTLFDGTYYLYAAGGTGTNNYLKGAANADNDNAKWTIAISGGVPTIKTVDSTVARHTIRFNQNGSNDPLFACYASGQTDYAIYRKAAVVIECDHANATDVAASDPTCTAAGFTAGRFCPDCEQWLSGHETIAALGHDYVVAHNTAPTCTEAGLDTYTCSRCSDSYTKPVAALGHTYENGSCTVCGAAEPAADEFALVDSLNDGDEVILYHAKTGVAVKNDNLGGDWYLGTSAVAPVNGIISTYDASIVWTVSVDAETGKVSFTNGDNKIAAWMSGNYIEMTNDPAHSGADAAWTISALSADDHTYLLGTGLKTNGYIEVYTKTVNSVSQLVATGYSTSAPDANYGFQFYVKDAEVAHNHVWDEGTVTVAATCTEIGTMTYACTVDGCEETYTEAIPALGHIDENSDNVCDRCETALEIYEVWTSVPEVGYDYIIVAEANGKYYALDNKENGAGQVLTCTEVFPVNDAILCTGDYVFTAVTAEDGANPKNEGIAFLQLGSDSLYLHLNSGKIRVASGTANAVMSIAVSTDADEAFTITAMQNSKALSFNGTKFVSGDTASAVYFYAKASAHVHAYGEGVVTTAPTCVAEGVMTYTCECGDSYTEAIPATGEHDYVEGTCSVCGAEKPAAATYALVSNLSQLSDGAVIVLGNAANSKANGGVSESKYLAAVDATFADGYVSGDNVVEITLNAVDGGWTLSVDGTAIKASGADIALCGEEDTATVWAISVDAATGAATISQTDYSGTSANGNRFLFNKTSPRFKTYTSAASASMILPEIYVKGGTIVVCEHTNTEVRNDVAATCTTAGYTGDTYCLDCGKLVAEGEAIAALGHNYVEGVCDRCGAVEPVAGEYEGLYYIAANGYYATNDLGTASTKRLQGEAAPETLPESVTIAAADNKTFEVVSVADGYVLKASAIDGDNYVGYVSNGVGAFVALENAKVFAISEDENGIHFTMRVEGEDVDRYLANNTSEHYFGWYKDSNSVKVDLALIPVTIDEDAHTHAYAWNNEIGVDGSHTLVCECGESKTEACADAEPVVTPATCQAYASTAYTCDVCGYTWTEEGTEYGAHNYEDGICTVCGAEEPEAVIYEPVTAAPADWTGTYLIGHLTDDAVWVFNGTDAVSDYVAATPDADGKIAYADGMALVTIAASDDGYTLMVGDKYMYSSGTSNGLTLGTTESKNAIEFTADGVVITFGSTTLRFNATSGQDRFRYYKTSTSGDLYTYPTLYKLAGDTPDVPPVEHEHNIYHFEGVAATCSAVGYAEYYTCLDTTCECYNKMYSDVALTEEFTEITIPALPHTFVTPTAEDADHYIAATCTEDGLYYEYCSVCGAEGASHEIAALGHDLAWDGNVGDGNHTLACSRCEYTENQACNIVEGVCTVCGYTEAPPAPVDDTALKFTTTAFTMGAELKFSFIMSKTVGDKYPTTYIEVVIHTADGDQTVTYNKSELTALSSSYRLDFSGIAAKNMGDSFTATIYGVDANGQVHVGVPKDASIAQQIKNILRKATSSDLTKTLAVDMLNYGAAAQVFFGYNTANLVNADLTAEELACGTQEVPSVVSTSGKTGSGPITIVAASVTLPSKVTLNMIFNTKSYTGDLSKLTYKVTDVESGAVVAEGPLELQSGTNYKCAYDDVGAKRMRSNIKIGVYDENGVLVSQEQTWSVESYIAGVLAKDTTPANTRALLEAMIKYGDSAAAFLG